MKKLFLLVMALAAGLLVSAQQSELRIKVRPTVATVMIDNQKQLVKGDGSVVVNLEMGEHEIVVSAEGFSTETRTINLQSAKEEMSVYLDLAPSTIKVFCENDSIQLFLNGEWIGNGTCAKEVSPGIYEVEARMEGFQTKTRSVEIKSNETLELSFSSLEPLLKPAKKQRGNAGNSYKRKIGLLANYGYSVSPQQSYGLTGFTLNKRWGGYINLMFGGNPFIFSNTTCDADGVILNYGESVLPMYNGNTASSTLSATGGLIFRFSPMIAMYGGLGYGNRKLLWQYDNDMWAKHSVYSHQGLCTDVGMLFVFGPVAVTVGVQTITFHYLEFKAGLGLAF